MSVNEAKFAAGPAISNTSAVPGDSPLIISDKAMGMEPVAHTYMGMAITSTVTIDNKGLLPMTAKKSAGTYTVISAAMTRPATSQPPMLPTRSMNP